MRHRLLAPGCALLLLPLAAVGACASDFAFTCVASPVSQSVSPGDPVIVSLTMTNSGNRDSDLWSVNGARTNAELEYLVRIHDQYGHEPNLTAHGQFIYHPTVPTSSGLQRNLIKPGQKVSATVNVAGLYVLKPHDTYRMSFEFRLAGHGVTTPIRSNGITVTVNAD